ncbi:MAG: hypothetical protein GY765_38195 [bacterium]|nr:hypothetical protein [bacterium]
MDEKQILSLLSGMLEKLKQIPASINENNWNKVSELLTAVTDIETKIKNCGISIDDLAANNSVFSEDYSSIKAQLLDQVEKNRALLEEWITGGVERIAGSRTVLDNISKYYKPPNTSYFIDKNE